MLVTSASLLTAALAAPLEPADLIVTHLSHDGQNVTIHVQNLGPGYGRGKAQLAISRHKKGSPTVNVELPIPQDVFGVGISKSIPLADLGVQPKWNSELLKVEIQAEQQARQSNKNFYEQIENHRGVTHNGSKPYSEAKPDLPDLVIEDVIYDGPHYLKVVYSNRGRGRTGADFVINLTNQDKTFRGNYYYRYRVPEPGKKCTTGGFTIGKLGLQPGMTANLSAVIDPEGRVRETDSKNNNWSGVVHLTEPRR